MEGKTFAENLLTKQGWTQGKGLGKNEHGIKEAIKVKIKQDSAGIGHDAAEEFTFQWWSHMFDKAADNIQVQESDNGVTVQKTEGGVDDLISKKKPLKKSLANKSLLYGSFVKGSTLTNEGKEIKSDESESSSDSEEESTINKFRCTDEQMLELCGGLTAHKAARHGLKLNGKLARINQQEAMYKSQNDGESNDSNSSDLLAIKEKTKGKSNKKKKKKEKKSHKDNTSNTNECDSSGEIANTTKESSLVCYPDNEDSSSVLSKSKKKKKSKKRKRNTEHVEEVEEEDVSKAKRKKKPKQTEERNPLDNFSSADKKCKRKKKDKR